MLFQMLLLVSQPLDRADRLNERLTKCLFATARNAHSENQSPDQFRRTLASSCMAEEQSVRDAAVTLLIARGQSRESAESTIDETLSNGRAAVVRAYSFDAPR